MQTIPTYAYATATVGGLWGVTRVTQEGKRAQAFLSVDPLTRSYPMLTPYQFAGNKPVWAIDLDGLEEWILQYTKHSDGRVTLLKRVNNVEIRQKVYGNANADALAITPKFVKYNKATGKPFTTEEIGTVQYQYYDQAGERLITRREFNRV